MSNQTSFSSVTARTKLPNLFPGQAQKEFFVNEAHAMIDTLLHPNVLGMRTSPPAESNEGDAWIIDANPQGEWEEHEGHLASYRDQTWHFFEPLVGMKVYDTDVSQIRSYTGGWTVATEPSMPSGGSVVDTEIRSAFAELVASLRSFGVFSSV